MTKQELKLLIESMVKEELQLNELLFDANEIQELEQYVGFVNKQFGSKEAHILQKAIDLLKRSKSKQANKIFYKLSPKTRQYLPSWLSELFWTS